MPRGKTRAPRVPRGTTTLGCNKSHIRSCNLTRLKGCVSLARENVRDSKKVSLEAEFLKASHPLSLSPAAPTINTVRSTERQTKGQQITVRQAGRALWWDIILQPPFFLLPPSSLPRSLLECFCGEKGAAGMIFRDNPRAREGGTRGGRRGPPRPRPYV